MSVFYDVPLFGRKWAITVQTRTGEQIEYSTDGWGPEALRVTFDIQQWTVGAAVWLAQVSIWNLNAGTAQAQINYGDQVTVSAGYRGNNESGVNYGIIWVGVVYEAVYDRVDVVNYKLTLYCAAGLETWFKQIVVGENPEMATELDIIRAMVKNSQSPDMRINISTSDQETLSSIRRPRGSVVFGSMSKYFTAIAQNAKMEAMYDNLNTWLGKLSRNDNPTPDLIYSPPYAPGAPKSTETGAISRSLLATPQQTPFGVAFTVLLDARLKCQLPPQLVKLDMAIIRAMEVQMSSENGTVPSFLPLSQDGLYVVGGVHHVGDTRGDDWYTEVIGMTAITGGYLAMFFDKLPPRGNLGIGNVK